MTGLSRSRVAGCARVPVVGAIVAPDPAGLGWQFCGKDLIGPGLGTFSTQAMPILINEMTSIHIN